MFASLKADFSAGFSVFLLALPLCLGIAMASNFPPIAGILTAIIGGIFGIFFGSSRLTIKGPAAGLIVICLGAVLELGGGDMLLGYKRALAVGVVAAVIQILFALFKTAAVSEIIPKSVIHGMLAAIGVIIISKQSHVMMGVKPTGSEPLHLLSEIPHSLMNCNPLVFGIGLIAFLIAIFWPKLKKLSMIPTSLMVLLAAIPLAYYFKIGVPHSYAFLGNEYLLGPKYLISLPGSLLSAITFPDFSVIFSAVSLKFVMMFALVGSIESLLTVHAVDSMDPEKKKSDLNKDLFATGACNLISSLLGGLPMISEIVRSKANIDAGAKSAKSNFFHGVFLLLSVVFLPFILQLIPLSALAALLVFVGFRLASPKEFLHAYELGKAQLVVFMTVLIVTLATDLLIGVGSGILLQLVLHLKDGVSCTSFAKTKISKKETPDTVEFSFKGTIVFCNYLQLRNAILTSLTGPKDVVINFSETSLIDSTIADKLDSLKRDFGPKLTYVGLDSLKQTSKHPLSARKRQG